MNEETQDQPDSTPEPPAPEQAPGESAGAPEAPVPSMDPKEVEDGKTFAILSYALSLIGIPFFLIPLIMRNNDFSLYHAKQCLMIWLGGVAVSVVGSLFMAVCIGFILLPAGVIFLYVIDIMGLVSAVNNQAKPVPLIGKYANEWFKGLTKA